MPDVATSAQAEATKSHIANTETDAEIIDTVELTGLKDNQEYYLRSTLMETTMNSANYGNYFIDASGKAVQPVGWRKKGKKKMAAIITRHSSIIKATMPKIFLHPAKNLIFGIF